MPQSSDNSLFSMLPERRPPWKEFGFSMSIEIALLVLLAWVGVLHPEVIMAPKHDHQVISLVPTPPPIPHEPQPLKVIKPAYEPPQIQPPVQTALRLPPEVRKVIPRTDAPVAPKIEMATKAPVVPPTAPVIPRTWPTLKASPPAVQRRKRSPRRLKKYKPVDLAIQTEYLPPITTANPSQSPR